jgi:hypothetical protein
LGASVGSAVSIASTSAVVVVAVSVVSAISSFSWCRHGQYESERSEG